VSSNPSSFLANVVKLVTGQVYARCLGILVAPIVTRLFLPEAFGTLALFIAVTSIVEVITCLRYEFAIMLPESNEEAANLLGLSLCSVLIITAITTLMTYFAGDIILRLINSKELEKYLWLVPVAVFFGGVSLALNYWNSRTNNFGRISAAKIVSSTSTHTARLGLGFSKYTSGGVLIVTNILGTSISTVVLASQIWREDRDLLKSSIQWRQMIAGLKRYKKFPIIDIWGALISATSWQLPALLLSLFFSPVIVGYYALSNALVRLPMSMIAGSIGQVFYQKICETKHRGEHTDLVENLYKRLVAFGLFPLLLLSIVGQDLFIIAFGSNWSDAGIYAQILAPWMFFTFISSPLSTLFPSFERQGSALIVHTTIFFARFSTLYIGGILQDIYVALALFSISGVIVYAGLAMWNMRLADVPINYFFSILAKYFFTFLPVGLGFFFLKYFLRTSCMTIFFLSTLTIIIYYIIIIKKDPILLRYFNGLHVRKKGLQHD